MQVIHKGSQKSPLDKKNGLKKDTLENHVRMSMGSMKNFGGEAIYKYGKPKDEEAVNVGSNKSNEN